MKQKQLVDIVARKAHTTKKAAEESINVFLNEIGRALAKGEKVLLSGFGTFRVKRAKGGTVKLPNSQKMVQVKAHRRASFTPGKRLKRQVKR